MRRKARVRGLAWIGAWMLLAPELAAQPLAGLERLEVSDAGSADIRPLQLDCPPGKVAISGGGAGGDYLLQSLPVGDFPTAWQLLTREDNSEFAQVLRVWCADPPSGFERVGAVTELSVSIIKSLDVECPLGKRMVGVGAGVFGSFAGTAVSEIFATDTGVEVRAKDLEAGGAWLLRADVLCAHREPLQMIEVRNNAPSAEFFYEAIVKCPEGSVALVGGSRPVDPATRVLRVSNPAPQEDEWYLNFSNPGDIGEQTRVFCYRQVLFRSGFEWGNLSRWSQASP